MNSTAPSKPVKGIQSLEVGFRILTAIQQGPGAVALKEIAARADVAPSAAHNYLASFIRVGMVVSEARGQYRLGPSLVSLGLTAARDVDHFEVVRAAAIALSENLGLGATVLVWNSAGPLIIFNKSDVGRQMFDLRNGLVPLTTTAGGHIFAAYLPQDCTIPVVRAELGTKCSLQQCRQWLEKTTEQVRLAGFSTAALVGLPDYGAISAPVWNANDDVAYALSLSAPGLLRRGDLETQCADSLMSKARELSRTLGAPSKRWS